MCSMKKKKLENGGQTSLPLVEVSPDPRTIFASQFCQKSISLSLTIYKVSS